jgi:hypothetical protein
MNVSVVCFLHCFDLTPVGNDCEGISDFITSLSTEGITSSVLLNALYDACSYCGAIKFVNLIDGAYQTVR